MGTSEHKKFMEQYRDYLEDQGLELGTPMFAKKAVDQFKLWIAVQEMGGHAQVMADKGWARVGRLFEPPKSMTDLSFRIRKLYETHVLPFEKAYLKGEIEGDVYMPPKLEPSSAIKPKGNRSRPNKRSSAPLPPRNQPKRARKVATPDEGGEGLVGRRVRVYWADDEQYFPGTVAAYDDETDKHRVEYDDGDMEMEDLGPGGTPWEPLPGPDDPPLEDEGDEQISSEDQREGDGDAKEEEGGEEEEDDPSNACCVCQGPDYKVYQSDDKKEFEIFCLAPGLQLEEISVKCWDNGKLVVAKNPKRTQYNQKVGLSASKHKILLPRPVNASSARAVVTLHGQLYINVVCQPRDAAEPAAAVAEREGGGAAEGPPSMGGEQGASGKTAAGEGEPQEHQHSTSPGPREGEEGMPPKGESRNVEPVEAPPPKLEQSSSQM